MDTELELRMYFLVPYNLSPIQQGIQAGHACQEYAYLYGDTKLFKRHSADHKTWIILNGGTTRDKWLDGTEGTLQESVALLSTTKNIPYAIFREPDLNYALTAICFICDERVWNYELYPDVVENPEDSPKTHNLRVKGWIRMLGGNDNYILRLLLKGKRLA